jgi:hypothetical protein
MPNNKLKTKIRERMAQTGEKYSVARLAVLAERGLPPDHPTSVTTARKREARIVAEYGAHLGIEVVTPAQEKARAAADARHAPAPAVVEAKVGGRVVGA